MDGPGASALRPLAGVRDSVATLRIGGGDADAERSAFLRVGAAIEASLRRALRDAPEAPMELRLRALAAEEMALDEVVAGLRQRDRLTIEAAAGVHDLAGARRRVAGGDPPTARDIDHAIALLDRLEREIRSAPANPPRPEAPLKQIRSPEPPPDRGVVARREALVPAWIWAIAAVAVLGVILLGVMRARAPRGPELNEGISLFRTGDYERAADRFQRYVAARPDDPTGRLYLARVNRRLGRMEEASQELRKGLEVAPADAALHRELGLLLLDVGQADAAVGRFRTAVELDRESVEGWLGLIRALQESGQPVAASNVLARAPSDVRSLVQLAP